MHRRPQLKKQPSYSRPYEQPSMQELRPMEEILAEGIRTQNEKMVKKQQLDYDYLTAYRAANYQRALKYKKDHSYQHKNPDGTHTQIGWMQDNAEFQKFGPGIYLYLQLMRRLGWLFFLVSIYQILIVVINWTGTGLQEYSTSFGNLLIYSTLGNYSVEVTGVDVYLQTVGHCAICFAFILVFFFWKGHNYQIIDQFQNGDAIVHPRKFCVEIEGLPPYGVTNKDLEIFFGKFGPVYECSLVYNYKDKLRFFHDVDEIDQKIKEEQLQIALGSGSLNKLKVLRKQKQQLANQINSIRINPKILSAFVHFQYESSKKDLVDYYANHYLFSTVFDQCCMHGCCCCCIPDITHDYLFKGQKLQVKNPKVTDPEEINWDSFDITTCSKITRVVIAFIVIVVFIVICSTLVALCSIFIQTNAVDCTGLGGITIDIAKTATDQKQVTCFCNSELFNFWSTDVQDVCKDVFKTLYIENLLQVVAAGISSVTNFIFGLLLGKIIQFTKPNSLSSGLVSQTLIYFLFLFINSIILPVLIYSDLYGVKPASYVSFIQVLIPSLNLFNMQSYQYYSDFTTLWYKNVSPFATNFLIIEFIIIWVKFIFYLCYLSCKNRGSESDQGKIIQKKMNQKLVSYEIDVVNQTANVYLVTFMVMIYSAGIPVIFPLGAAIIISRYITNKHMIIHHSKRIQGLTQNFNLLSVFILPFSVMVGSFVGIWMLTGSSYIYPDKLHVQIPGTTQIADRAVFLPRIFYLSFTFILGAVVVFYIFFYNLVVRFFTWIFSCCCNRESKVENIDTQRAVRFSDETRTMNVLYSYNIHNNDRYKNAILNLERFLEIE